MKKYCIFCHVYALGIMAQNNKVTGNQPCASKTLILGGKLILNPSKFSEVGYNQVAETHRRPNSESSLSPLTTPCT